MRILLLILLVLPFSPYLKAENIFADKGYKHNEKGNKYFEDKKYIDAIEEYTRALSFRKDNPEIKYNLANSLYENGKFEEALKSYEAVKGNLTKSEKSNLYYNMGNTFYKMNKLKEAKELYKKALMENPSDKWAKENYELVLKKIEEQKQQQNKKDNKKDNKDKDKDKKKQQNKQNDKDKQDKNKKKDDKNNQQQNKKDKEKNKQQQKQQNKNKQQMRKKENREKLLKALEAKEKENRKKNAKKKSASAVDRPLKDW